MLQCLMESVTRITQVWSGAILVSFGGGMVGMILWLMHGWLNHEKYFFVHTIIGNQSLKCTLLHPCVHLLLVILCFLVIDAIKNILNLNLNLITYPCWD